VRLESHRRRRENREVSKYHPEELPLVEGLPSSLVPELFFLLDMTSVSWSPESELDINLWLSSRSRCMEVGRWSHGAQAL
jgi:hypothetical protein